MGRKAESDAELALLVEKFAAGGPSQIAEVYAARGELNSAFEWLDRAYEQRDGGLADAGANPNFRNLHADPRWESFVKRMGFKK